MTQSVVSPKFLVRASKLTPDYLGFSNALDFSPAECYNWFMNITLHANVELYVKQLVDSGAFPSAESAVNSLVAQLVTKNGVTPRLPSPIGEIEEQPTIPDFPRGVGVSVVLRQAATPRLPDLVGLEHLAQRFAVTFSRIALPEPYETKP